MLTSGDIIAIVVIVLVAVFFIACLFRFGPRTLGLVVDAVEDIVSDLPDHHDDHDCGCSDHDWDGDD